MSKKVAVYARVSTTRQAENDISIPDQLAQARRYCEGKGWHIVREFVDPGASARGDKRPQFQRMLDEACTHPSPFDVVLVHSQSRFFRDLAQFLYWKRKLQKHGVALVSITQDFGSGDSADVLENMIAIMDEYQSKETAKHVTRTMLENARQGYWNGAKPPFGYCTAAAEQRGQRTKKRLEIQPREAEIVRQVFTLCREGDGRSGPMGIKDIASWLNTRGFKNANGNPFYTSEVHKILTREDYIGTHHYNRQDSRTRKERPREEWVAVPVPAIISAVEFQQVQKLLYHRRPSVTAPRITNSPVLLTGLVRCKCCGAPLMLRTGKSGRYRYYTCSGRRLKGKSGCSNPSTVPMAEFDHLVISALTDRLLTPERLPILLREAQRHRKATTSDSLQRRSTLRKQRKEIERQINNLLDAVADGTVPDAEMVRDKLGALKGRRDECTRLLSRLEVETPPLKQALSKAQAAALSAKLRRRFLEAPVPLQRRYVRGLVSEIIVDRDKAVISGPKAAIAAAITAGDIKTEVLSSVREWRARKDSNL